jgi:hypothetical protein
VAESHIEFADAMLHWELCRPHASHQAEGSFLGSRYLDSINFPPDNNNHLEENNNCKDVAMVSDAVPLSIDVQSKKNTDCWCQSRYQMKLASRPLLTQSITTAVLFATGDTMAQQLVEKKGLRNHDLARSGRMALYGGGIFTLSSWSSHR